MLSGAKACKSCRSRQELSNEYLLAKFGFDTAENEPLKVCQKLAKHQNKNWKNIGFVVAGITAAALVLANLPADFGALSVTIGIRLASNWPLVLLAFAMACVGHVHMEAKEIDNSGSCNGKEQHAHCVELIDPCVRTDSK